MENPLPEEEDWDSKFWSLFDMSPEDMVIVDEDDTIIDLDKQYMTMLKQKQGMNIIEHRAHLSSLEAYSAVKMALATFIFVSIPMGIAWSIWYWIQ